MSDQYVAAVRAQNVALYSMLEIFHFRLGFENVCDVCVQPIAVRHHWVHRRRQEGKCKQCGKVGHKSDKQSNHDVVFKF